MSGWQGSNRRAELPPDWYTRIRPQVLDRDSHRCQSCGQTATDVDHIGDKHDHRLINLQALCGWCHRKKTSRQGNYSPNRVRATESRPRESHPGIVDP
ncbi:HNH endonuclease [Streptomyces venezuelae]